MFGFRVAHVFIGDLVCSVVFCKVFPDFGVRRMSGVFADAPLTRTTLENSDLALRTLGLRFLRWLGPRVLPLLYSLLWSLLFSCFCLLSIGLDRFDTDVPRHVWDASSNCDWAGPNVSAGDFTTCLEVLMIVCSFVITVSRSSLFTEDLCLVLCDLGIWYFSSWGLLGLLDKEL